MFKIWFKVEEYDATCYTEVPGIAAARMVWMTLSCRKGIYMISACP